MEHIILYVLCLSLLNGLTAHICTHTLNISFKLQASSSKIRFKMEDKKQRDSVSFAAPVVGTVGFGKNWERRRQTMAMFSCSLYFILPMVLTCWISVMFLLYIKRFTAVPVACYLGYVFLIDRSGTNGLRSPILRAFRSWWAHACDYLPLLLVKTANLDPDKNYVMGYHPHGIISVGCFCAFATDGARTLSLVTDDDKPDNGDDSRGFSSLFPGIDRRVITLPQNFMTPFLREYFLCMGAVDSAKETFRNVLARKGTALVVVVGGAAESMIVQNHSIDLILEKRRGFVREAILANACLVPVIGFGESDLYQIFQTDETTWIARIQDMVKRATGIAMPIFQGRSIFLKEFGVMPNRTPVCVVVGAPIEPPELKDRASFKPEIDRKTDKPLNKDGEVLIEWHEKYMKALKELYKTHEDAEWNLPGRQSMTIVK